MSSWRSSSPGRSAGVVPASAPCCISGFAENIGLPIIVALFTSGLLPRAKKSINRNSKQLKTWGWFQWRQSRNHSKITRLTYLIRYCCRRSFAGIVQIQRFLHRFGFFVECSRIFRSLFHLFAKLIGTFLDPFHLMVRHLRIRMLKSLVLLQPGVCCFDDGGGGGVSSAAELPVMLSR